MRKLALILGALLVAAPVSAAELVSAYTDVDIEQCEMLSSDEVGATWACEGLNGYPVTISEGDLRMTVSYGEDAINEVAMSQGFGAFNRLGAKMEWLSPNDDPDNPVATILRNQMARGLA